MRNLNVTPGTCPTCKGQGVCQQCHGDSAVQMLYGKTYLKYPKYGQSREIDPANVPQCSCANGACPQCGHTGKILIPN